MSDYFHPTSRAWLAEKEIADKFPDYIVEGICWSSRGWARIKKNSWGVPVYSISGSASYDEDIAEKRRVAISPGNISDLPDDFGPWVGKRIFYSNGPFILGHTYRVWAGIYGPRPNTYPSHVREYDAEFLGVDDDSDMFKVINDRSKLLGADPEIPLATLVGKVLGYEHRTPREALDEENEYPIRTWYLGPKQAS